MPMFDDQVAVRPGKVDWEEGEEQSPVPSLAAVPPDSPLKSPESQDMLPSYLLSALGVSSDPLWFHRLYIYFPVNFSTSLFQEQLVLGEGVSKKPFWKTVQAREKLEDCFLGLSGHLILVRSQQRSSVPPPPTFPEYHTYAHSHTHIHIQDRCGLSFALMLVTPAPPSGCRPLTTGLGRGCGWVFIHSRLSWSWL